MYLTDKALALIIMLYTDDVEIFGKCYEYLTGRKSKDNNAYFASIVYDTPYYKQFKGSRKNGSKKQ